MKNNIPFFLSFLGGEVGRGEMKGRIERASFLFLSFCLLCLNGIPKRLHELDCHV